MQEDTFYEDMDEHYVNEHCVHCRSTDIRYDIQLHESACANCGIVGMFDTDEVDRYYKPKTYYKGNYFMTGVIHKIMTCGLKLTRNEMNEMSRLFNVCVNAFNRTKDVHKRKNMISTSFTFLKIAEHMGMEGEVVKKHLKMPKPDTLARLEKHWVLMNPFP